MLSSVATRRSVGRSERAWQASRRAALSGALRAVSMSCSRSGRVSRALVCRPNSRFRNMRAWLIAERRPGIVTDWRLADGVALAVVAFSGSRLWRADSPAAVGDRRGGAGALPCVGQWRPRACLNTRTWLGTGTPVVSAIVLSTRAKGSCAFSDGGLSKHCSKTLAA